ncbi:hypothetical protein ACFHYQ_09640 [Sphaerimonospora cavernae]|uniref:Uncharacterized protein n=1 Tax=Sphaerimonospora cavernae TaxID=1740611 RepID=A0ABV6U609_9ACTN
MIEGEVRPRIGNDAVVLEANGGGHDSEFGRDVRDVPGHSDDRRASSRPVPERSCPPWCMDAHIDENPDERIHNAWVQAVDLHAIPLAGLPQRLWLDLVLGPGDDEPRIHLQIDDRAVIEMTITEARSAGMHLIGLAALAVMETPPA